ncbi:MAG: hypothetical protein J7521_14130 [Caulobacter sp.]|nr:hypothetical protein [Caulobacter sp.]
MIGSNRLRRLALAVPLLAMGWLAASPATAEPQRIIKTPVWAREPDNEQFLSFYPPVARAQNKGGWAVVACRALASGGLAGCKVAVEAPADLGFGAAARRMAAQTFTLKSTDAEGVPVDGGWVSLPIVFQPAAKGVIPPLTFAAGQPAMLVTELPAGETSPRAFSCPAADRPSATCVTRPIQWKAWPDVETAAAALRAAGQTSGVATLDCVVGEAGRLTDCQADGDLTPAGKAAILRLSTAFAAPPQALDGTPTRGARVASVFDWATLLKTYEVLVPR